VPIALKSGSLRLLETSGNVQACNRIVFYDMWSWYIVGGTATSYGLDGPVSHPARDKGFYDLETVKTGCGIRPASYSMGTVVLSKG